MPNGELEQVHWKENGEAFDITIYSDGDQIVNKYQSQYDIILMDVEMKFMDGMSAAEEIRKVDTEVVIIFITNMAQYAIRGYAVDALDYVLKPVSYFAFSQRLNRAIGRMKKRETKMIMVSMKGGTVRINIANIYYIESQGHTLILHTILGDYETTGTMKEMEEKLADMNFCRGNKGYLINLAHVDGITDGCAMVKGEQLVLSRARKKEFMEELTNTRGEVSNDGTYYAGYTKNTTQRSQSGWHACYLSCRSKRDFKNGRRQALWQLCF